MLIDIQKWIKRKFKVKAKTAYRIVYYLYGIITFIPILAISYMFDTIPFTLVAFVVTGILRKYSYGLHFTNGKCIYITIILLISLGILSKNIPLVYSFFIALWCVRDIYIKSPLKLTVKDKSKEWHESRILLILGICLGLATIGLYFNWYVFTNSILCSLIMVDLTLFLNKSELG